LSHRPITRLARGVRVCSSSTACRAHTKESIASSSGTHSRRCTTSPPSMPLSTRQSCLLQPRGAGRRSQVVVRRLQGATTTTDHDDDNDVRHSLATTHSDKRQVRPPTDHFKRLLEEACRNHAYPVMHKLKDYGLMRTSASLTLGAEAIRHLSLGKPPSLRSTEDAPHWEGAVCLT
jgi:hypothetical protein